MVDDLLGPPHGECRNDQLALLLGSSLDGIQQHLTHLTPLGMHPVAIGAFHDHVVGLGNDVRITQNGCTGMSDIAAEDESPHPVAFIHVDTYAGRTQHVAGVPKGRLHVGQRREQGAILDRYELTNRGHGILAGIQRFEWLTVFTFSAAVDVGHVGYLDVGGIQQHPRCQVSGCRSAINRAAKSFADQRR